MGAWTGSPPPEGGRCSVRQAAGSLPELNGSLPELNSDFEFRSELKIRVEFRKAAIEFGQALSLSLEGGHILEPQPRVPKAVEG